MLEPFYNNLEVVRRVSLETKAPFWNCILANAHFNLGAIDQFGNKTATWDALRRINLQIHALAPVVLKLRSTGVYHSPEVPEYGQPLTESKLVRICNYSGQEEEFGREMDWLAPGAGILFRIR
jgi:hypothetical protein